TGSPDVPRGRTSTSRECELRSQPHRTIRTRFRRSQEAAHRTFGRTRGTTPDAADRGKRCRVSRGLGVAGVRFRRCESLVSGPARPVVQEGRSSRPAYALRARTLRAVEASVVPRVAPTLGALENAHPGRRPRSWIASVPTEAALVE